MVNSFSPPTPVRRKKLWLTLILLSLWAVVSFVLPFWARELSIEILGWPFHYWMSAHGSILISLLIVVIYAKLMNRWEAQEKYSHGQNQTKTNTQD
jgi:putative solute:sodium symporter small subunit